MKQDILPLYMIIIVLFGNITQVFAATFPVSHIPVVDNVDVFQPPQGDQPDDALKIKKNDLARPDKKPSDSVRRSNIANTSHEIRHTTAVEIKNRLDRNSVPPERIRKNNPNVVKGLLETMQDKVPLLDDEKMSQIEWVAKDLSRKLTNLNVEIDQAFNKIRVDSFIMNALFPIEENAAVAGFSQAGTRRSLYNQSYANDMNTTQLLLQPENIDEPKGFFAFILSIPRYLFEVDKLIKLLVIFIFFSGIYKALHFFMNNRW